MGCPCWAALFILQICVLNSMHIARVCAQYRSSASTAVGPRHVQNWSEDHHVFAGGSGASLSEADSPRNHNASAIAAIWDCSQTPNPVGLEAPANEQVEPAVDATPGDIGTSQPGIACSKIKGGSPSRRPLADQAGYLNQCFQPQQPPIHSLPVQQIPGLAELAVQLMQRNPAAASKARSFTCGASINAGAAESASGTENIGPGKAAEKSSQRRSVLVRVGVPAAELQAVSQRQPHSSSAAAPPLPGNQVLLGLSACAAKGLVGLPLSDGQNPSPSATAPSPARGRVEEESEPGAILVPISLAASESPWRRRLGSFANHGAPSRGNAAMSAPAQQHCSPYAAWQSSTVCQTGLHRANGERSPASTCRAAESVSTLNESPQHPEQQVADEGASAVVGAADGAPEQLAAADTPGERTY